MTETNRQPVYVNIDLHRSVKIMAAEQSISMRALTERLLRLGMIAPELAEALSDLADAANYELDLQTPYFEAQTVLVAYRAAIDDKEAP